MKEKKQAINISLLLILINFILALGCWFLKALWPFAEFLFSLFSGILGSGLAALWIFVWEYRREKFKLFQELFQEINHIRESLPYFHQYVSDTEQLRLYLNTRYYQEPLPREQVKEQDAYERTLDSLCRFVDQMLALGYEAVDRAVEKAYSVDFWWPGKIHRDTIRLRLGYALYSAICSKPAEERGYVFRYFRAFRDEKYYTAGDILDIVVDLHQAFHVECDCGKANKAKESLNGQLYKSLWIFRSAFFSSYLSRKEQREAMDAFLHDTPYNRIR